MTRKRPELMTALNDVTRDPIAERKTALSKGDLDA